MNLRSNRSSSPKSPSIRRTGPLQLAALLLALPALAGASGHLETAHGPGAERAIELLKAGNARFRSGKASHPKQDRARLKSLAAGQKPFATILGCSDSRVPPELVFDQGLGDLFVVRVAGNVADAVDIGSIEYASEHLGVPLVVVLGHHRCGAVQATADAMAKGEKAEGNLGAIVSEITPSVQEAKEAPRKESLVDDSVHANAKRTAAALVERSPVLKRLVEEKKVKIVTAVYDLDSGTLEWP